MDLKAVVLCDALKAATALVVEVPAMAVADASLLSESELQLASAMISVSSPLPFQLQSEHR